MLRLAFATTDQQKVDLHFGASERIVIFEVSEGQAELVEIGEFNKAEMKGAYKDKELEAMGITRLPTQPYAPSPEEVGPPSDKPPEDKVIPKLEFIKGCSAVYAASIGASSIKRLMSMNVQPIIVDNGYAIIDLLNQVNNALRNGGLAWVERAVARGNKSPDRFVEMAKEEWQES